jgi:hypothetical protein
MKPRRAGEEAPLSSTELSSTSRVDDVPSVASRKGTEVVVGGNVDWRWTTIIGQALSGDFCAITAIVVLGVSRILLPSSNQPCVTSRGSSSRSEKSDHTNNC